MRAAEKGAVAPADGGGAGIDLRAEGREEAPVDPWTGRLRGRLLALAAAVLLLAALLLAAVGLRAVEQRLAVEVAAASSTIGRGLAQQFQVAIVAGVPFEALTGVEAFLRTATGFDPRIGFAALLDAEGRVVQAAGPAAAALPARFEGAFEGGAGLRHDGHLAMPVAVGLAGVPVGYVLVGVETGLPPATLRSFLLHAALALLALLVLLREALRALLSSCLERPAEALARLAAAVRRGDLSRTTWLAAPGPLGRLLVAARARLASVNGRFHAFLLSAFAARAGHFEPPVLREITGVVRDGLADYRLPPVTGARPVPLGDATLLRVACFALLLGEALLLPGWLALPALQGAALQGASVPQTLATALLPPLLALPFGLLLARRLLPGFAEGLVFTAGALIAAAAQLGLALAETAETVLALRLLGGLGLGLALQPLARGAPLAGGLLAAAVAGAGPGLLALLLLGPQSVAPLAALVTAAAGLLVGLLLPGRSEPPEATAAAREAVPGTRAAGVTAWLPVAGFAATLGLIPAALVSEPGLRDQAEVSGLLLLSLALLAAGGLAGLLLKQSARRPVVAALPAGLAALLLALLAGGTTSWLPLPPLPAASLLVPAVVLACMALLARRSGLEPAAAALAAAAGLAAALLLQQLADPAAAAALAAVLMLAAALVRRPA